MAEVNDCGGGAEVYDMHEEEGQFMACDDGHELEEEEEVVLVEDDDEEVYIEEGEEEEKEKFLKFEPTVSHEAKLRELLRNIVSVEKKLCSYGSKEFMKLLRGDSGGSLLCEYVRNSPKLSEIMDAWRNRQGKSGFSNILFLLSVILDHPEGKFKPNDSSRIPISRSLDKFSKSIVEEKLGELNKELESKEGIRQKAVLLLLAAIVRRGSGLASEVARVFDFKQPILPELAEYRSKKVMVREKDRTREAFIEFAMSFLEVGNPGLFRWVLQKREMFSGILRGLGNDNDETVVFVLSTLRDRVLTPESLVPSSLRSVLFGSVTLEQLIRISSRDGGGRVPEIAHKVLVMVCTDPANGLMPDLKKTNPFKGNPKRLLDLMKKLNVTEVKYHRELLMSIVSGQPALGSAYLDEFPYNVEDHSSSYWFSAVSLAASLIFSVRRNLSWEFLERNNRELPAIDNSDIQNILKCVCPRPFSRSIINKGLQHSDSKVKHATLKLLLENLKLFELFSNALLINGLYSLKQEIESEVRILLPDPQVLFALLNPITNNYRSLVNSRKRPADLENASERKKSRNKKQKLDIGKDDDDIIVGGIITANDLNVAEPSVKVMEKSTVDETGSDYNLVQIIELWDSHDHATTSYATKDAEVHILCKVLEALKMYHRTLYPVMEVSYDLFKIIPSDPLEMPSSLLQSLLSVLIEYIGWPLKSEDACRNLLPVYKHLQSFINLLLFSSAREIKDQAYVLAQASFLSTGAFDGNPWNIGAWFLFLPGYRGDFVGIEEELVELYQNLSRPVISFLCDAISTVGNNLVRYWNVTMCHLSNLRGHKDVGASCSPLIICILEKCLRLLSSESVTFSVPEKTLISLYVCNTLKYLLETQVEAQLLSSLIYQYLSENFGNLSSDTADPDVVCCELRPLKYLIQFSKSIIQKETCTALCVEGKVLSDCTSFVGALSEVKKVLEYGSTQEMEGMLKAFYLLMVCSDSGQVLQALPSVLTISLKLYGTHPSPITPLCFLDQNFLVSCLRIWPEVFRRGLKLIGLAMPIELASEKVDQENTRLPLSIAHGDSDFDPTDLAAIAFGSFLGSAPFHLAFSAMLFSGCREHSLKVKEHLLCKLSEMKIDQLISSLRFVLFWMHQIRSACRVRPLDELIQKSKFCCTIVEHILTLLLIEKVSADCSSLLHVPVVAETIFSHPAILASFSCPLPCSNGLTESFSVDTLEGYFRVLEQKAHEMDRQIVGLLIMTCDHFVTLRCCLSSVGKSSNGIDKIGKALNIFVNQLFSEFKEQFDSCAESQDLTALFPVLYTVHALMLHVSPFVSLELAHWALSRISEVELMNWEAASISPVSFGFLLAAGALNRLTFLHSCSMNEGLWVSSQELGESSFSILFEDIYFKAVEFSIKLKIDGPNLCLLEAINSVCQYNCRQETTLLSMNMARVITCTPVQILSHCINATDGSKAKFLLLLTRFSPLHLSIFGRLFLNILKPSDQSLTEGDYLRLLPAALTYFGYALTTFGKDYACELDCMLSLYARIIKCGFLNWKNFVSQTLFEVECGDILPSSNEELLNLMSNSLLGQAVHMLKIYFMSGRATVEERFILFDSICPSNVVRYELLSHDYKEMKTCTGKQLLGVINRVVAKISLCDVLLFSDGGLLQLPTKETHHDKSLSDSESSKVESLRVRFLNMLVSAWQLIVKKFRSKSNKNDDKSINYRVIKFLEERIFLSISELTEKMHCSLVQLDSLPFLEKIFRFTLLHRFDDPFTLHTFRRILCSLSQGHWPTGLFLQLFLGHSQLPLTLQNLSGSSTSMVAGVFLKPLSSILRSLDISSGANSNAGKPKENETRLEVIKLLRTLFHFYAQQHTSPSVGDMDVNLKELLFLLLSSYGATMSETDLEINALMHEIESTDGTNSASISELDYLWGSAALRFMKEFKQDQSISNISDTDDLELDRRRSLFREILPVDPKLCVETVLHFPYQRTTSDGSPPTNDTSEDNVQNIHQDSGELEHLEQYDPVFLLRFSIHCLSRGYLDALEFAGVGLLAVALVSISSPNEGLRKLGYEVLGRFKNSLEKFHKKKEVTRLRLLLTYLQNGIEEPWQKFPSIISLFAAEASVSLLDPSHDRYPVMSKLLTQFSHVKLKTIPLLEECLLGNGVNFKSDRLWMLHLIYTGVNLEDDALILRRKSMQQKRRIFLNNSILEVLMSVHASPLSDTGSKELILQILKKSVKLKKIACHLVENCGLIPWLSSIIFSMSVDGYKDTHSSKDLVTLLEVAHEAIASVSGRDWLHNHGYGHLSDLLYHLVQILFSRSNLVRLNASLINAMFKVVLSAMEILQKRERSQPHFTLSLESISELHRSTNPCNDARDSSSAELRLSAALMCNPPVTILSMGQEELSQFLSWAVFTSLTSDSRWIHQGQCAVELEDTNTQLLTSKLLRWLVASVIVGKISSYKQSHYYDSNIETSNMGSLLSSMECFELASEEEIRCRASESEKILAAVIFHLQQLLGIKCRTVLSSVVTALSMLVLCASDGSSMSKMYDRSQVSLFWSKIRCPPESNPAWRWSYFQPWQDSQSERTALDDIDELHACQALVVTISGALLKDSPFSRSLSYRDLEACGVFDWERSILETKQHT